MKKYSLQCKNDEVENLALIILAIDNEHSLRSGCVGDVSNEYELVLTKNFASGFGFSPVTSCHALYTRTVSFSAERRLRHTPCS